MAKWVGVGILALFLLLVLVGIGRQMMQKSLGDTAVPTLVPTVGQALLPVRPTAVNAPTATAVITLISPTAIATPPPPTPTATTSPRPQSHTIQAGETLFSLAQRYGLPLEALAAANGITNPNRVLVGQVLVLPTPTVPAPAVPTQTPSAELPPPTAAPLTQSPAMLNGIPLETILVLPEPVRQHVREIFAQGQALGRNPHAYSKVGDSTIQNPYFMARFEQPDGYNLGEFAYLQPTIAYFAGSHGREGAAVRKGLHSWTVTDPMWADKAICQPNETPIACEIRLHNPAILIIRLGSNDAGVPEMFEQNVRVVIELALANGVVPIIGTKADRFEGSNINNDILRRLAAEYQLPLWDFDQAAQMIPGRGLDVDHVHLTTYYAHDYSSPLWTQRGHSVHNLTALMMLDAIRLIILEEQETAE